MKKKQEIKKECEGQEYRKARTNQRLKQKTKESYALLINIRFCLTSRTQDYIKIYNSRIVTPLRIYHSIISFLIVLIFCLF